MHSETAVFDERFAMIGGHDLDALSWKFNPECNVSSTTLPSRPTPRARRGAWSCQSVSFDVKRSRGHGVGFTWATAP